MKGSTILAGLMLIALGVILLLLPLFPNVSDLLNINQHWPLLIVFIGGLFLLGAFVGSPGLAVPGSLLGGIGLMLYYQNVNSAWSSWAYSWTLILVFIGIGIIISRAIQGNLSAGIREGGRLIVIGLILFAIFGSFLGLGLGISFVLAIVLIGIGIWMVARVFFKGKGTAAP